MSEKVTSIAAAQHAGNHLWTPQQMLQDALQDFASGKYTHNKALAIFLDDKGGRFSINWGRSNLRASETLALLEVMKADLLKEMNYLLGPEDIEVVE